MMNNKMLAILGTTVISLGTIGSVAFANTATNSDIKQSQQIENSINKDNENLNTNACNGTLKNGSKSMMKIMKDNSFKDAAKYMKSGDYEAMTDYMKSVSEEDYDKMIKIMNENGYENMGKMMKFIGRKGMIQMHKTRGSMHNQY